MTRDEFCGSAELTVGCIGSTGNKPSEKKLDARLPDVAHSEMIPSLSGAQWCFAHLI
jgi:hypothetical protein